MTKLRSGERSAVAPNVSLKDVGPSRPESVTVIPVEVVFL